MPHKKGCLLKKGEKGVIKGWKKRWFVLEFDRLFYYKRQCDTEPINFVPLQRVASIELTKPFDSATKKNPNACFQV